jgi:pimeloyl-ACP methyl ester carboxylesterase
MSDLKHSNRGLAYTSSEARLPWRRPGRPVVFHHGVGANCDIWAEWLPAVGASRRVVRFDFRGFGSSTIPPADHPWSMRELIDDVLELAGIAGPGPVHLIGESMGGTVVLAAALEQPHRVASVTISNAAYKGSDIGRLPGWKAEIERDGVAGWAERMMTLRFAPGAADAEKLAWFAAEQARASPHVLLGLGALLAKQDLSERVRGLEVPLLILSPDSSPFVSPRQGVELVELVPHAELCVFPGVRHGLPFSHAEEAARITAGFLDRVERGEAKGARVS